MDRVDVRHSFWGGLTPFEKATKVLLGIASFSSTSPPYRSSMSLPRNFLRSWLCRFLAEAPSLFQSALTNLAIVSVTVVVGAGFYALYACFSPASSKQLLSTSYASLLFPLVLMSRTKPKKDLEISLSDKFRDDPIATLWDCYLDYFFDKAEEGSVFPLRPSISFEKDRLSPSRSENSLRDAMVFRLWFFSLFNARNLRQIDVALAKITSRTWSKPDLPSPPSRNSISSFSLRILALSLHSTRSKFDWTYFLSLVIINWVSFAKLSDWGAIPSWGRAKM